MSILPLPVLTPEEIERFWLRVTIRHPDQCWRWERAYRGSRFRTYGTFNIRRNGKSVGYRATRIMFLLHYGRYPEHFVCHTCDKPWCVNPHHLFEGTAKDNAEDMLRKGRGFWQRPAAIREKRQRHLEKRSQRSAEEQARFGMDLETANDARRRWATYQATEDELMHEFGLNRRQLRRILNFEVLKESA